MNDTQRRDIRQFRSRLDEIIDTAVDLHTEISEYQLKDEDVEKIAERLETLSNAYSRLSDFTRDTNHADTLGGQLDAIETAISEFRTALEEIDSGGDEQDALDDIANDLDHAIDSMRSAYSTLESMTS